MERGERSGARAVYRFLALSLFLMISLYRGEVEGARSVSDRLQFRLEWMLWISHCYFFFSDNKDGEQLASLMP
jgi:hypothetical protein